MAFRCSELTLPPTVAAKGLEGPASLVATLKFSAFSPILLGGAQ